MELNSVFKLVTKSGYKSLDVVKRSIQHYARLGMPMKMLEAVYEMDAFETFSNSESITTQRAAKAIRTNMINRLKVILFEDVSFSQIDVFITVIEKISEWEDEGRTDKNTLAEIVSLIVHAKKLRLPSWLQSNYGYSDECKIDKNTFLNGIDNQIISCIEWIYYNDEEALKMLNDRSFYGKEYIIPMITAEWKRLKPTKSKIGSNDRFIFVVVPWLWVMYENDINHDGVLTPSFNKKDIKKAYVKKDVVFQDYVNDKSVDLVSNEDVEWLSHFEDLKDNHKSDIQINLQRPGKIQKGVKPKRLRRGVIKTDSINDINIDINDITLMLEGVSAGKLPCGYLSIKGKDVVIKPMTKSLNYGMDYAYIDHQKRLFGINNLDIKIRKISGKKLTLKKSEEQDETSKKYEWEDSDDGQVIAIMTLVNVKDNLSKCKTILKDKDMYKEMMKIRLFNGFFRTSDNVLRNILVDNTNELWAIDENDIYGKRKNIFNKNEYMKKSVFLTAELVESVIEELDFETHEETLIEELEKYFPLASCKYYEHEIRERVLNYKQIVMKELGLNQ